MITGRELACREPLPQGPRTRRPSPCSDPATARQTPRPKAAQQPHSRSPHRRNEADAFIGAVVAVALDMVDVEHDGSERLAGLGARYSWARSNDARRLW